MSTPPLNGARKLVTVNFPPPGSFYRGVLVPGKVFCPACLVPGKNYFIFWSKGEPGSMRKSREILLRLYHDPSYRFDETEIWYVDRGAPGDLTRIRGDRVIRLDPYYLEIESGQGTTPIPYHRLYRILYEGTLLWERGKTERKEGGDR